MPHSAPREWVKAWRPAVAGISEVFHARFVDHRYPPHAHDDWTLFVVDDGAIRYDLDTRARGAERARVAILPPHVVHDGRPATADGFRKRVLYVDTEVLPPSLIGPAVDTPDLPDADVARMVGRLHGLLEHPDDALEAEGLFAFVAEGIRRSLQRNEVATTRIRDERLARSLRELLDAQVFEPVTLADAGKVLGATTPRLVRCFARTFGVTPHRYVIGRRIDAARKRLLDGEPIATAAAAVGFYDQAHFTRHFRRYVGSTPHRFATSAPRTR